MGFTIPETRAIVNRELEDYMVTGELTSSEMDRFVNKNGDYIAEYKKQYLERCAMMMISAQEQAFNKTHTIETKMVESYSDKMDDWLEQLNNLDITEQDEEGNFKNTARFFVIHEAITKLHKTLEKLSGTGSMRELSVLSQKMQMEIEKARMLGDKAPLTIEAPTTKFTE
jgi:uncharacterized protein (UPF0305 family)